MSGPIKTYTYLCIGCPLGCRLEVDERHSEENPGTGLPETARQADIVENVAEIVEVRGFACKRGDEYARQEHRDPRRMVTTTVAVKNGRWARLPVRTSAAVPKQQVQAICRAIGNVVVAAPVTMGQVIVADVLQSGVDVIATRDMPLCPDPSPGAKQSAAQ